jgi:hypothetical protein
MEAEGVRVRRAGRRRGDAPQSASRFNQPHAFVAAINIYKRRTCALSLQRINRQVRYYRSVLSPWACLPHRSPRGLPSRGHKSQCPVGIVEGERSDAVVTNPHASNARKKRSSVSTCLGYRRPLRTGAACPQPFRRQIHMERTGLQPEARNANGRQTPGDAVGRRAQTVGNRKSNAAAKGDPVTLVLKDK